MRNAQLRNEQIWLVVGSLMILATVALAGALLYTRDVMIPFVLAIFITAAVAPLFRLSGHALAVSQLDCGSGHAPARAGGVDAARCRAHRGRSNDG